MCSFLYTFANSPINLSKTITWDAKPIVQNSGEGAGVEIWSFEGATYNPRHPSLPYFMERFTLDAPGQLSYEIRDAQYEAFDKKPSPDDIYLSENLKINTAVEQDRRQFYGKVFFIPIRKVGASRYERLVSFELVIRHSPQAIATPRGGGGPNNSILRDGNIYKVAVTNTGMHTIGYDFLKNDLQIDIDNVDPRKIHLLGNGGGPLPEAVGDPRPEDLQDNAIQIVGEEDGSFDAGDYILFYAEGPNKWVYDTAKNAYVRRTNIYDDKNYYFIKIDGQDGKRIGSQTSLSPTAYTSNVFDDYDRIEEDRYNILSEANGAQGSGQEWFGDPFNPTRERSYDALNFPNLNLEEDILLNVRMAARSRSQSRFSVTAAGQNFNSANINSVNFADSETSDHATLALISERLKANGDNIPVTVTYPAVGDGTNEAWLDYIEVNVRRQLTMSGTQMDFRDQKTTEHSSSLFEMRQANGSTVVWEVSDPTQAKRQQTELNGSTLSFGINTNNILREFIAFDANASFEQPEAIGQIGNQNLHSIDNVDLVIITHKDFQAAAERLAEHRRQHSELAVETVLVDEVYNEFSSGRVDPTAIRDFARLLFERTSRFRYLLLFGDGSFDPRDAYGYGKEFIPVFETHESMLPVLAYPSDDYYALLNTGEGGNLRGALDIAVGRIPTRTSQEADAVVNKIINYDSSPNTLGDWRNRLTFIADDEDANKHIRDSDTIAEGTKDDHPVFNINKVFFDAFQQESTPGGARYPKAQESLNRDIFRGVLVVNYLGHGGSRGWAQERVLTQADIDSWNNFDKLPLFVTATCSFTGYDEPQITTAGEQTFLKADGGAIALFSTTRAVYATSNFRLTTNVFDTIFQQVYSERQTIGEILRNAKNSSSADTTGDNARKFTLIGDPSMFLAVPRFNVVTTTINGNAISTGTIDTIKALQKVTIEGLVQDEQGNVISDFNGKVYPTIFDKELQITTLAQDPGSQRKDFNIQKNILFKGVASVTNGRFKFTFVVPKDIDYQFGRGKISYYAENGSMIDAHGESTEIIIGGADENALNDDQGPMVEVFMNSEDFIFGGNTDPDPTLLVKLSDDNGINVVGNSIGHDLTGVLDQNTQNTYVLNDFYEAELDDYTRGEVRFPLFDLAPGKHEIRVKAWDIANNSSEGFTEFFVADSEASALSHVLNYPNPFTTNTDFRFEYNQRNQSIDVQVQIFTVSGRLVKTIQDQLFNEGGSLRLNWDGKDDYGDQLAKGVYVYKIKVQSAENLDERNRAESDFERLVILK